MLVSAVFAAERISQATTLIGTVYAAGAPVSNASVTLYGESQVVTATSDSTGAFGLNYTSCSSSYPAYVTASGGTGSGGANAAIGLIAVIGPCSKLAPSTRVTINEFTTVATLWAFTQFFNGQTISGFASGQNLAFESYRNLASVTGAHNSVSGAPSAFLPTAAACAPTSHPINCDTLERLNTIANILAACTGSSGPGSIPCTTLNATTTLGAAYEMALHPSTNVATLFGLQSMMPNLVYQPALTAAPDGFEIALSYGDLAATALALDAAGNLFSTDGSRVTELTYGSGYQTRLSFDPPGANLTDEVAIALDGAGNVFTTSHSGNSVSEITAASNYTTGFNFAPAAANLSGPYGLTLSPPNNIVFTLSSPGISELTSTSGYTNGAYLVEPPDSNYSFESPPIFDKFYNLYAQSVNQVDGTAAITELTQASGYTTARNFSPPGICTTAYSSIAIRFGNIFCLNAGSVGELNDGAYNTGSNFAPAGAQLDNTVIANTQQIALDSAANIFVTDYSEDSVSELTGSGYTVGLNFAPSGQFASPGPITIDSVGNVWVANLNTTNGNGVTELLGLAQPTLTPIVSCTSGGGCRPTH